MRKGGENIVMHIKEQINKVLLFNNQLHNRDLRSRELEISKNLLHRWDTKKIEYEDMIIELHGFVRNEGVDKYRVLDKIFELRTSRVDSS
jgi:hypothetical protein